MYKDLQNLPEKFLKRVTDIIPERQQDKVFTALCTKRPITFRANILKITADELEKKLHATGIICERIPWYTDAFTLRELTLETLTKTYLYQQGYLYIQSLSSMIPVLALDPKDNEAILDLAAAPGSKTTQIAMMMHNSGQIVANDISATRVYRLKSNLEHQGVTNTKLTRIPGQFIWKKYPEYFDKTLVDAPCSLEGRINCYDPKSYQDWSPKKIELLSQRERYLLRSAISATKVGGIIVYSTCTLSPEENEEVIDWVLKKEKDAIAIEPIEIKGIEKAKPILTWKKKTYDPQIKNTLRIFPSATMEGFFVAKIRKIKPTTSLSDFS